MCVLFGGKVVDGDPIPVTKLAKGGLTIILKWLVACYLVRKVCGCDSGTFYEHCLNVKFS